MNESDVEKVKVKYVCNLSFPSVEIIFLYSGMPSNWAQGWSTIKEEELYLSSANVQAGFGKPNSANEGGGAGGQRPFINFIKKQEKW